MLVQEVVAEATEREARAKELKKKKSKEAAKGDQEMKVPEEADGEGKAEEQEERNDQQTTSALAEDQSVWVYIMAICPKHQLSLPAELWSYVSQTLMKFNFSHHKQCMWLYFLCAHKCIHISYLHTYTSQQLCNEVERQGKANKSTTPRTAFLFKE